MIEVNIAGYAAATAGGFVLGMVFGRKLKYGAAGMMQSMESRISALEHSAQHNGAAHPAVQHAAAIEKLASAIEKHAAAVDDHGAATVAAAVESNAKNAASTAAALSANSQ